ncbi:MAG: LamG domain-containing protein [Armatimonas sp.]
MTLRALPGVTLMLCGLVGGLQAQSPRPKPSLPITRLPTVPKANSGVFLEWLGRVDTDISFGDWFDKDFTLTARFFPRYANNYAGPIVAENGSGSFAVGMGDVSGSSERLALQVGNQTIQTKVALTLNQWHQLAVVRSGMTFTLYLDGEKVSALVWNGAGRPTINSTLSLGRRTDGWPFCNHNSQFFGLIDDVAIFSKALSDTDLKSGEVATGGKVGAYGQKRLSGYEPDLLRGVVFDFPALGEPKTLPVKLNTKTTFSQKGASIALLSPERDSAKDSKWLRPPTNQQKMLLPTPPGEVWAVIQGNGAPEGGSHRGYAAFCWDLIRVNAKNQLDQPSTKDAPMRASGSGRIVFVRESTPDSKLNAGIPNCVMIEQGPGEFAGYLHLRQGAYEGKRPDGKLPQDVPKDKQPVVLTTANLARVGDTGAGIGAFHIHFALTDDVDDGKHAIVTIPSAFHDYLVSNDEGKTWQTVSVGVPQVGQWIKTLK